MRPCRKAIPAVRRTRTHNKQNASFAFIRVKGRCPLRVQGGARESLPKAFAARRTRTPQSKPERLAPLPKGNPRRKANPNPQQAKRKFCAYPGQGTMSLAGAGRSPQNYCRKAIPAEGAPDPQQKQAGTACANRRQAVARRQAHRTPKSKLKVCALLPPGNPRQKAHPTQSNPNPVNRRQTALRRGFCVRAPVSSFHPYPTALSRFGREKFPLLSFSGKSREKTSFFGEGKVVFCKFPAKKNKKTG